MPEKSGVEVQADNEINIRAARTHSTDLWSRNTRWKVNIDQGVEALVPLNEGRNAGLLVQERIAKGKFTYI
jgi:hypothetical protein